MVPDCIQTKEKAWVGHPGSHRFSFFNLSFILLARLTTKCCNCASRSIVPSLPQAASTRPTLRRTVGHAPTVNPVRRLIASLAAALTTLYLRRKSDREDTRRDHCETDDRSLSLWTSVRCKCLKNLNILALSQVYHA